MNYFNKSVEDALTELNSSRDGLNTTEAKKRLETNGANELLEKKEKGVLSVFLSQFADLLVIILIIAAIISSLTGSSESTFVIICVIIANAIIGTVQHFKAQKSLKSLKEMSAPSSRVIRDGKKQEIMSRELVEGDVIVVEAGDVVPADARIIKSFSLKINESALTGESEAIEKTEDIISDEKAPLGDRKNMMYSSSLVTYGRAIAVVTATGMNTEIGKIATLMNMTAEKKTPLQVTLDKFSKNLSILIMAICAVVFGINLFRDMPILDSLMFAVSLAVAAIPEALSSIVTISLAIGTSKMAKQNAIVKNLNSVEGLGCVSVICSDKTGTLTQNKMTVEGSFAFGEEPCERLLLSSILCNDTCVTAEKLLGDPTESCLVSYYNKLGFDYNGAVKSYPRLGEIPFDSVRKMMSTVHNIDGKDFMLTKGAVDMVLDRVTKIMDGTTIRNITEEDIEKIKAENLKMSENGLRVLSFAEKEVSHRDINLDDENGLTFLGLISMMDPPREESAQAVSDCIRAGIKPIMITGDHKITATAIAKKIGIFKEGDMALTGAEADALSDEELTKILPKVTVYARVSPENKIRIVNLWQSLGHIVAMTGDGVNDAPALKSADIGIAMGITGTEVSKDAASVILTDDNFATIIKSVANGRNIYANIKNSIKFLLSGNTSGILAVLYASIFALPMPFSAVHLLFINLLTDSLPAIAISMENPTAELLDEKPRSRGESILSKDFLKDIASQGLLIAIFTVIAFHIGLQTSVGAGSTMAFATLCSARLFHSFNSRSKQSAIKQGIFSNKYIIYADLIGFALLISALFVPFMESLFDVTVLSTVNKVLIFILAFMPTLLIQVKRMIMEKIKK